MILRPNKYTNIDFSVLGLSADILTFLKTDKFLKYPNLVNKILQKRGELAKVNILFAITFLYTIGKLRYYVKEDVIESLD